MQNKIERLIGLDFKKDDLLVKNRYTLRKLIGVLGIMLPLLLPLFLYMYSGHIPPLESISHYYYTQAQSVFTIIISLMAVFLMIYKTEHRIDFYISFIAGFFALMVIFFPTDNINELTTGLDKAYIITIPENNTVRIYFHYISAAIFLLCLTYMSLFQFTKPRVKWDERTPEKKNRNAVYIICGVFMSIALIVILLGAILKVIPEDIYMKHHLTFWMETVAVICFGISWLVKGEAILGDQKKH